MKKYWTVALMLNIAIFLSLFLYGLYIYFSNQTPQERHKYYISNSLIQSVDSNDYEAVNFFTTGEEDVALEQHLAIHAVPQMILKRVIKIFLLSNETMDIYLVNTTGVGSIWTFETLIQEKTIRSWHNVTVLHEVFNETLAYFPGLIIFNPTNYPLTCNLTISQEILLLHPNYDIVFRGFWMAVLSFFILTLVLMIYCRIDHFYFLIKVWLRIYPPQYRHFLKVDYEFGKKYLPTVFLLLWLCSLLTLISTIITEHALCIRVTYSCLSNIVKNMIYSLFISPLIFCSCFILTISFLYALLSDLLSIPKYFAFRSFNDFILFKKMHARLEKRILKKVGTIICIYVLLLVPIIAGLSRYSDINLILVSLIPLMIILGFIQASEIYEFSAHINPFKAGLLEKFDLCVGGLAGGFVFCISYLPAYYLIPWEHLNRLALVLNIMSDEFSEVTNFFLLAIYLLPVVLLIFYLTFTISLARYIPMEDQEKFKKDYINTPLTITAISFFATTLYNIFDKASRLSGDPLKRIIDAVPVVLNINSLSTSILMTLAIMWIKDYYTLAHSMNQLKDK